MRTSRLLWLVAAALILLSSSAVGVPTATSVHVTAVGDIGSSSTAAGVLDGVRASGPDAHFALGDLSYGATGAEQAWCDFVTTHVGSGFPFELLSGNHESNGQNGNINDFSACLPNQLPGLVGTYGRQYHVDLPAADPLVRFVMISPGLTYPDGAWDYSVGSARYRWTVDAIDGARRDGVDWVVVGMHKPCLSVGAYGCDVGPVLANLLVSKRVDLVISGHEHNYQRTKQLSLGTGCSALTTGAFDADCVVDGDDDMTAGAGTVFMTIGTGGVAQRDIMTSDPEAPYFAATAGANQDPTYGFGDVTATPEKLTVGFTRTSGGAFTDGFTLTRSTTPLPPNQPPAAFFSSTVTGLAAALDATQSSDPDGAVVSYDWDFGDGRTGTGAMTNHTYTGTGTYEVTLTVTDDDGATSTHSAPVTVSGSAPPGIVAADSFERTVVDAWGTADLGGTWQVTTSSGLAGVSSGKGRLNLKAGGETRTVTLPKVSSTETDLLLDVSLDKLPVGSSSGHLLSFVGRRVTGADLYRSRIRLTPTGTVLGSLWRKVSGTETRLGSEVTAPGLTYASGDVLNVRTQVSGTNPTTLRMRVWRAGTQEPTTWLVSATDSTPVLQAGGSVQLITYLPSTVTNAPIQTRYDNLLLTRATTP